MKTAARLIAVVILLAAALAPFRHLWLRHEVLTRPTPAGVDASGQPLYWFKGNTHSHAKLTLGEYTHGDATTPAVVRWYHDHGYHFIAVTDHNRHTAADERALPREARSDFLVVSGMEVTSDHRYPGVLQDGERKIHMTAFNTGDAVAWSFDDPDKAAILSLQAERIFAAGGVPVINHPNYRFQLELDDILRSRGVRLMEIANEHPRSNHAGHAGFRPDVEQLWDRVLSSGRIMYGVATDDAHDFAWFRRSLRGFGYAPPGGAWVMVRAPDLTADALGEALMDGAFYGSTGVYLRRVSAASGYYEVDIDMDRTRHEVRHHWIRGAAPVVESDDSHFVIEFIGSQGRLLHSVHDQESAKLRLEPEFGYVRARITYLELVPDWLDRDRARAYYAWTQPVMTGATASAE